MLILHLIHVSAGGPGIILFGPVTHVRHELDHMMTSSNGNIFRVTGLLCGEFTGEFPTQRPVARSFDVFFDLRLNKRLSKQPWGWWFETPSWSLWRQCNGFILSVLLRWLVTGSWWHQQMESFPRYWSFVRGIHRSPVNSPHKGKWGAALRFFLIRAWTNSWVYNRDAGDLGPHNAYFDVIVTIKYSWLVTNETPQTTSMLVTCSSRPSDAYASENWPSSLQIMPCYLDGARPLSEPMLEYCYLDPWDQTSVKS